MDQSKTRRSRKKTKHHRKPRCCDGGAIGRENISYVPNHHHEAFHTLFACGYPALSVARELNHRWLCHDTVMLPIPTEKLPAVLQSLFELGIFDETMTQAALGLTEKHLARCLDALEVEGEVLEPFALAAD